MQKALIVAVQNPAPGIGNCNTMWGELITYLQQGWRVVNMCPMGGASHNYFGSSAEDKSIAPVVFAALVVIEKAKEEE
jgi:hypothetical protein